MLFAFIIIIIISSSGTIFANSMNGTAENLFTKDIYDSTVSSFQTNDNSIDFINQVNNSINNAEVTDDYNDSNKPVIKNTDENSANNKRDNSLSEETQNEIIGKQANTNVVVNNTITENKNVDIGLSTENVVNLITTNNQNLKNLSSGILAAGDGSSLFSKSSILNAATNVKKYVEQNGKLPNYVTIANQQVSMSDFLYLLTKSIVNTDKKNDSDIFWKDVKDPSKPSGNTITGNLNKNGYLILAGNVLNYIEQNGQAPNYGSTSLGKVQFQTMIYAFSRILDFTKNNGVLPNYVTLNTKSPANLNKIIPKYESKNFTGSISVNLAEITDAGSRVEAFYNTNKVLPNYVTISGKQYSMAEFLYLASTAIVNINNGIQNNIVSIAVKNPSNQNGNSKAGEINKNNYIDLASRISGFIAKNGQAPNYGESTLGKVEFKLLVIGFSKILQFTNNNNVLPNYVTLTKSGSIKDNTLSNQGPSLNDTYNGESLTSYLVASTNCQVNDEAIKTLAIELTKGSTSEWQKAESIFNYVRDKIAYSFYWNTKYGAKNTLKGGVGNCVDQSHLLIALCRASGIAARYVNGEAKFISGNSYGHVWAQIKVGNTWVVADTTSKSNSLGMIQNWYTNTAKIHGKYASISF
ncbi:MAG: pseudomurein-binding protein [Methanobacteriaceae archaeon]|jgi:hypothetical protein|nr:pseudomurein-binding protein [Candidatus Methanorudis spinitermitis]